MSQPDDDSKFADEIVRHLGVFNEIGAFQAFSAAVRGCTKKDALRNVLLDNSVHIEGCIAMLTIGGEALYLMTTMWNGLWSLV